MVSYLPDFKYHIPSALWYLVSIFLFFEVFYSIKLSSIKELKTELNRSANILIFYPMLSIFLGISNFFNSFSELIFFLTRRAELLTFERYKPGGELIRITKFLEICNFLVYAFF